MDFAENQDNIIGDLIPGLILSSKYEELHNQEIGFDMAKLFEADDGNDATGRLGQFILMIGAEQKGLSASERKKQSDYIN